MKKQPVEQAVVAVPEEDMTKTAVPQETETRHKTTTTPLVVRRTRLFAGLVLLIGSMASASFFYLGIQNGRQDSVTDFDRRASELVSNLATAWHDYEVAGLWIHEACASRQATRQEFRSLYEYLRSSGSDTDRQVGSGLDFQAAEFIPNVTHAERAAYEHASRDFYTANHPNVLPYVGFRGLEPDPADSSKTILQPRSEQNFYFPVYYVEPVESNAAAIGFDLYSSPSRRATIEAALSTYQPHLTRRLRLVQETDASAYSVLLMHPGIPLSPNSVARDLSLMVIRIPSLLERAVKNLVNEEMAIYVYDVTASSSSSSSTADPEFLGGVQVIGTGTNLASIAEIDYSTVIQQQQDRRQSLRRAQLLFEYTLSIGASEWTVVVTPLRNNDHYQANIVTVLVGGSVLLLASVLLAVWMVHNVSRTVQMQQVMEKAQAEEQIITSLFPSNVRDRLLQDATAAAQKQQQQHHQKHPESMSSSSSKGSGSPVAFDNKPIADLFPDVTIMFGDLVGFTAWASARDPTQVFTLLETVYNAFDEVSIKAGVFKLETVGDCYVAVSGCPEPRSDHALCMARFATQCIKEMDRVAIELEPLLGPDTGDLGIRIGLHSGQVTAGVLRGLKGRFQLFGDCMNTASRMESTGKQGAIQVSRECAEKLRGHGKAHWLVPRKDEVVVKGKGRLNTYWLSMSGNDFPVDEATSSKGHVELNKPNETFSGKSLDRLVTWNVEIMTRKLKKVIAHRQAVGKTAGEYDVSIISGDSIPMNEVKDTLHIANYDARLANMANPSTIELEPAVKKELQSFMEVLAIMYENESKNHFHNFEHASHVTMSVMKLLTRMGVDEPPTEEMHMNTFGIASDPLLQLACVFSAIVHDASHPGVPNFTLIAEKSPMASAFCNKSIAEQNSIEIAWNLFTQSEFSNLRRAVCGDQADFLRLRELVVSIVCATDVMDKEINAIRRQRWDAAFDTTSKSNENSNRKATIVIEHLIQASDVSHTMQHWHIYTKWNRKLFMEMYQAYQEGRLDKDPTDNWVAGECGFLDHYAIPLAKKLNTCGVFGVSSDEFLNYAVENRREWEVKGPAMVAEYKERYFALQQQHHDS